MMARLVRGKVTKARRLYLLDITMPNGMQCVKIGVSSGVDSVDRMMQINRDIFQKYRKTAMIGIKRDRSVEEDAFAYESELHRFFGDYRYDPKVRFDGSTECFVVALDGVVDVYEYLMENGLGSLDDMEYDPDVYVPEANELSF